MNPKSEPAVTSRVKIVVYVPVSHADLVREAMAMHGAGIVGNYSHNSFSIKGIGRFRPLEGAHPTIGTVGTIETVEEERIETTCETTKLSDIMRAIKDAHPYEEPAIDVYPLISPYDFA